MPLPPLVLCPGLDGTGRAFGPLLARLAASGTPAEVVRYAGACATVDDYVRTIDRARTRPSAFEPGTPHLLVAESFSGPLAIRSAASTPPLGLVLVATFRRRPRRWPAALLRWAGRFSGAPVAPPRWAIQQFLTGDASPELLSVLQEAMIAARPHVGARLRLVAEHDAGEALVAVRAPVLLLTGTVDRLVTPADTDDLRRLRPDASVATFPAAHLLLQTRPEQCLAAIQRWGARFTSDSHERPEGFASGEEIPDVH